MKLKQEFFQLQRLELRAEGLRVGHKGVRVVANGITIETNGLIWGSKELTVKAVLVAQQQQHTTTFDDVNNLCSSGFTSHTLNHCYFWCCCCCYVTHKQRPPQAHNGFGNWASGQQPVEPEAELSRSSFLSVRLFVCLFVSLATFRSSDEPDKQTDRESSFSPLATCCRCVRSEHNQFYSPLLLLLLLPHQRSRWSERVIIVCAKTIFFFRVL